MIDRYVSGKLKVISFVSMLLVVFRHAYNLGENLNIAKEDCYSFFIQVFISSGFTSIAVPVFFSISGYFLFLNKKQSFKNYRLVLSKRFSSLVIPYLFWSISWFLLYFFKDLFIRGGADNYTLNYIINQVFINPIPLQFWFIRDLFVLVIVSPLIYFLIKYSQGFIVFFFAIIWYLNVLISLNESIALLYFSIGSYLGINGINLKSNKNYGVILIGIWLCILFFQTFCIFNSHYNTSILEVIQNDHLINLLDKSGIIIGILAVWNIYDFLFKNVDVLNLKWFSLTTFSFFIYAFHLPLLWMMPNWIYGHVGKNQFSLLIYFVSPTVIILFSLFLGKFLKKNTPVFFGLITGGR